jgi:RNA polymerase sigma-70 factor (ECF subfamily)
LQPNLEFKESFPESGPKLSDSRFEELVNAHGRHVLNVALRTVRDAEMAKDVYQEVFLAIWRRWPTYTGPVHWGRYLYRVTVRKALELARGRRPAPVDLDHCEPESPGPDPDATLRLEDVQRKLTESLAKLPKHQAEVFVLSRIEGLDHATIAEIFGCTQNNVRVSLHRAVKQLAGEMSDYLDGTAVRYGQP